MYQTTKVLLLIIIKIINTQNNITEYNSLVYQKSNFREVYGKKNTLTCGSESDFSMIKSGGLCS